jgi:hypothetical protein
MTFGFHQLKNHFKNDHLSDWFDLNDTNEYRKDKSTAFYLHLVTEKRKYIESMYDVFNFKYPHYVLRDLNQNQVEEYIGNNSKNIFLKPTLYSEKYDLSVQPDIIIHKDIFKEIFVHVDHEELPNYLVLDVLHLILHLSADKTDILNQGNIYYYKCKIALAISCLTHITDHQYGFFLAKDYKHKDQFVNKKETIGRFRISPDYFDDIRDGVKWLKRLRQNHHSWVIHPKPSVIELYPNMNCHNSHWSSEKNHLGHLLQEITLVWNISYEKRCKLIDQGITSWTDSRLFDAYELRNNLSTEIKQKMIHINQQTEIKISPRKIKNRDFISSLNQTNTMILDIESVAYFDENESYFNDQHAPNDKPKICIIGTITNDGIFKDFTIPYLKNYEEKKIITHWISYLKKIFKEEKIYMYHWGNAEKVYLKYMKHKYSDLRFPDIELIDLCFYFKKEPIVIQGCFGYGLKEIAKYLYNHNLIEHHWKDDLNGLDAMHLLLQFAKKANENKIPMKRYSKIKEIVDYNDMDCRVVYDIVMYLRTNLI